MNITKLNNGHYRARETVNGKALSANFDHKPTQAEAKQKLYNLQEKTGKTFLYYANQYIDIKSNVLSASTIKGYVSLSRKLESFGELDFEQITQEDIQKFINRYSVNHTPKTVSNMNGFISSVFKLYKPSMIINITLPKKANVEPYIPTESEVKLILEYAKEKYPNYYIPFVLGACGLRRGEICALNSEDVEGNSILIRKSMIQNRNNEWLIKQSPKSKAGYRKVIVPNEAANFIKDHDYAYLGSPHNLNNRLQDIQKQLNIKHFTFHKLRHYYCCMCHNLGIPDIYISKSVGHEHISTTQNIYTHADNKKIEDMQNLVKDYFCTNIL